MKRPFAVIGFTSFFVLLILSLTDSDAVTCCVLFISALIGILSLYKKNLRQAMTVPVCLFAAAAACLLFLNFSLQKQTAQHLTGDSVKVNAVVAEAPYLKNENGRHYCVLSLQSVDGTKAKGRLRLSFSPEKDNIDESALEIGNHISFTGKVYVPGEADKSISRYFTGENVLLGAYSAKNVSITDSLRKNVSYYFHRLRSHVAQTLRYGFGDKIAGLLVGILTGDKSCLDARLYDSFRQTGMAHLMAVSGLHLSLWVFTLGSVIPEKRKTEKLRCILLMSAVIFIMLLAGMSESVKRAGFMSLVFLSGKLVKKDCDSLNSLGLAVTLILFYKPSAVLSVSLQLSFLATLGILTLGKLCLERSAEIFGGKRINSPIKKLMRYISDMFFISLSVLIFTFPVLFFNFGGFSQVSAWVNILIAPVVSPLLICAGVSVLLSGIPFVFYPTAVFVKLLSSYVIFVTEFFANVKNSFVVAESENAPLFLSALLISGVSIIILIKGFKKRTVTVAACVFAVTLILISGRLSSGEEEKIHLAFYEDTFAAAVGKDKRAVLLSDTEEYEKGLFVSSLEDKGVNVFSELVFDDGITLKGLADGKHLTDEKSLSFFDGYSFNADSGEKILVLDGKYIHIFYGEALQYEPCCDIIIQILADDVTVITSKNSLSLKKEKKIELII